MPISLLIRKSFFFGFHFNKFKTCVPLKKKKMDVNRLLTDELSHELYVRGLPFSGTVAEKRAALRGALKYEKQYGIQPVVMLPLNFVAETDICSLKLQSLAQDIQNFDNNNRDNEFQRINSRLLHLLSRLSRLPATHSDQFQTQSELKTTCLHLIDTLNRLICPPTTSRERSILDEPNPTIPEATMDRDKPHLESIDAQPALIDFDDERVDVPVHSSNQTEPNVRREYEYSVPGSYPATIAGFLRQEEENDRRSRARSETHMPRGIVNRESNIHYLHRSAPTTYGDMLHIEEEVRDHHAPIQGYEVPQRASEATSSSRRVSFQVSQDGIGNGRVTSSPLAEDHLTSHRVTSKEATQPQDTITEIMSKLADVLSSSFRDNKQDIDVRRLGLIYDGRTSVTNFLEKVEDIRQARGISKERLFKAAPEMFTDEARNFYKTRTFTCWEDLVFHLRERFLLPNYEEHLMMEIRRRTQGEREYIATYVDVMERLFGKLSYKMPEESRLSMIRKRLRPSIQEKLTLLQIPSLQELYRIGRLLDETEVSTREYQPPPTNLRNLLEPSLAYHASSRTQSSPHPSVAAVNATATPSLCWNCKRPGHRFQRCDRPLGRFCFKCGTTDVITATCPRCSKNGPRGARQ